MNINAITGRVTVETAAGHPVAGLEVVAISKARDGKTIELGRAITNGDGEFKIVAADFSKMGGTKVALAVRDARRIEIEVVTPKTRRVGASVNITIPLEAAQEHGRHVTVPASPDIPFVPLPHMLDTITRAVDLIALQGTPLHDRYLEAARCPLPPWQLGVEMYRDALDVLRGNPFAASRFVELVELVSADLGVAEVHSLMDKGGRTDHVHHHWVPGDVPFLPPAKTIPIFAAAAMIAKSGLYSLDRIGQGVLTLLCHFEDFGFIHRLAVEATLSKQAQSRFAAVLDWRLPECGPMPTPGEPGIPWPEKRKCLPWLDWHRECFNATLEGESKPAYTITQVTPAVACPGDVISITGTHFGSSGIVVFRRLGGGELDVVAQTWTDTLITVAVPATAAGGLWLRIPAGTRVVCGVVIEASVTGQVFEGFDGSAPYIEALHLGGSSVGPFVVKPGAPISLHWRVYGATGIVLNVFDETGAAIVSLTNPPGNGYLATLNAPMVSRPRLWQARVAATGPCAPGQVERSINIWISEDPVLVIDDIEVTQAIQLTGIADKSVTLVRNKTAWVRVYFKSFSPPSFNGTNWTGVQGTLRVERIENGQVTWTTTLNPQNVMVTVVTGATYTDVRGDLSRTLNFEIPAAEARGRIRLTATCTLTSVPFGSPILPKLVTVDFEDPGLFVEGLEVTQAIQYYKSSLHLTDTADQQADNSVTLVRNKAAWVRVYLKSSMPPTFNGTKWTGIQGTLRVERIENGQVTSTMTLNPQNALVIVTAGEAYADVRGTIGRTLNFVIPAAEARGRIRVTATCTLTSVAGGIPIPPGLVTVDFALQQRLRLAGIMVAYNGPPMVNPPPGTPNLVLAAPTVVDLDATLPYTLATYPIGVDFQTRNVGTVTLTVPLSDPRTAPGACSLNWGTLLNQLANARNADGNQAGWSYYGLLPNGVPINVPGCGGAVAGGFNGDQGTLAHELGHVFGRTHAPCGNAGPTDGAYPAYEPYDTAMNRQAVIGEYGLDNRTGTIHPPTENDFMSYCSPQWVSLHNYAAYTNAANLNPVTIPVGASAAALSLPDDAGSPPRFDMINVVGSVDEDGRYHVDSVARAPVQLGTPGATQTKVQLELLDADGRKLGYSWILAYVPQAQGGGPCYCGQGTPGEPPSPPYIFEARLLHREGGVVLRIREGERVLWERRAFHIRPHLKIELCRVTKRGKLQLRWSSRFDADSTPDFWVQWAPDRSEDWRGLAVGLRDNETILKANALSPGKHRIRVSLHDGFTSAFATKDVKVPERGPTVSILHPNEGEALDGSQGLLLWGRAVDSDGRLVGDERLEWRLNKRKVGTGGELRLSSYDLGNGKMEAELIATSASGRSARKVHFRLVGTKHTPTDS